MPINLYLRGTIYWGSLKIAGREYRSSLRTPDAREAARRLRAWRLKLERASLGSPDTPTFKAAVVRWATEVLPNAVKPAVATRYLSSIAQLEAVFGSLRVDQITAQTIGEYVSSRANLVTNATIRRDLTALSRMMAACTAWGWIPANPVTTYDRGMIRERREPIEPPQDAAVAAVLLSVPPGIAAVLRLLHATGMRENEAVTLTGEDILWERRQIALRKTKTNRPRTIDWRTPAGDAGPVLAGLPRSGPLFTNERGEPYRNFSSNFSQAVRLLIVREADAARQFRRFRVHDLRHGFAIRSLRMGWDIYSLSKHLGHTSIKTTEIYLAHLTGREQVQAKHGVAQTGAQTTQNDTPKRPERVRREWKQLV